MKTFWLIRHGESTSNAGAITTDPGSTPLTDLGRQQAEYMAQAFTHSPDLIVTSPYIRTQQTAEPTRHRFAQVPHEEWLVQEFNSLAPQKYNGTRGEDRRPGIQAYWRRSDPHYKDEGVGESFIEVIGRVATMFDNLKNVDSPFTAIFAHGIFNSLTMWYWLNDQSVEKSAARMRYFPFFRMGFDTRNCSYIKGTVANNKIALSPLQIDHLPSDNKKLRLSRRLATAVITRSIQKRGNGQE